VSEGEEVLRIAAKGDGVTASGRFVWASAPGDLVLPDGTIQPGPHHVTPPPSLLAQTRRSGRHPAK